MTYALNLADDGRVLSATRPEFAPKDAPTCEELPDGDISDYLFQNGSFVYDPLPVDTTPDIDEITLLRAQVQALTDRGEFLEDCIAEMAGIVYA